MYSTHQTLRNHADSIHNYFEPLVLEILNESSSAQGFSDEELSDVACIALNSLPPKYIRHEVDLLYFSNDAEKQQMRDKARRAVQKAIRVVKLNTR